MICIPKNLLPKKGNGQARRRSVSSPRYSASSFAKAQGYHHFGRTQGSNEDSGTWLMGKVEECSKSKSGYLFPHRASINARVYISRALLEREVGLAPLEKL